MPEPIQWGATPIQTANTARDGTGDAIVIFTAKADTYIKKVVFRPLGTCVATAGRVFVNNGQEENVARNNALYDEKTLPSVTASEVAAIVNQEIEMGLVLKAGQKLLATIGTTVSAGYAVIAVPGDPPTV